jgi:hypothetical protein
MEFPIAEKTEPRVSRNSQRINLPGNGAELLSGMTWDDQQAFGSVYADIDGMISKRSAV